MLLGRRQAPDGPGGSSPKHFLLSRALSRAHVPSCPLTLSRGGLESPPAIDCGLLCGDELPPPSTQAPRVGSSFPKWQHGGVSLDTASPGQKPGRRPSHPARMLLPSHESSPSSPHRHIILISQVCEQATSPKARGSSLRTWGTLGLCCYLPHSLWLPRAPCWASPGSFLFRSWQVGRP